MKDNVKAWIESIVETIIIILILYFVFFPFKVNGVSMEGTLSDGDRVFASRIVTAVGMYEEGDLIIFEKYIDGKKIKMVKRVIALENDTVLIKDGELYINDILQDESYIAGQTEGEIEITLGKDEIFVMGDNRCDSTDSREFGVVSKSEVTGKVILKAFPISDFKVFL